MADLRLLCCDAGVVPIVMNGPGQPLDVGRIKRNWTDGQRRAIRARDRGSPTSSPGADTDPSE